MSAKNLHGFLRNLPAQTYENELQFLSSAVPEFIDILGYSDSQIYFETTISPIGHKTHRHYVADAIVAARRVGQPWILIETKVPQGGRDWFQIGSEQLRTYQLYASANYGVLFTPEKLLIVHDESEYEYSLRSLTLSGAKEIYALLKNPGILPKDRPEPQEPLASDFLDFETFKLNRIEYVELLKAVFHAEKAFTKGQTLENLVAFLFEAVPFLTVKYRNLRTSSSEIDLVIQNEGWERLTVFDEYGRYLLVECRNWSDSVGAKHIRDFKGKLKNSKVRLGILFAKNGVSGAHSGADALLEIHNAFQADDTFIIVLSEEDLRAIENGANFYEILDDKIDHLRFGL